MLTDQDNLYYSPVLLLWDVQLFSNFHLLMNLGAYFWVTVLADHCMIVACTRYFNGNLPDRSRQSVLKNQKTVIFSSIIAVGCAIIQQLSSADEFGGIFLGDSPCRPLHDCGLVLIISTRSTFCTVFCNIVTLECGIIQQFLFSGEFRGIFLSDSPYRSMQDCGLYTLL